MKEDVFELIRKEDVILFVGAGFSRYAGYPDGGQLTKLLLDGLNSEEKKHVKENLPLPQLVDRIISVKNGSRIYIDKILKSTFLQPPKDLTYHKMIAEIPHIHYIITTNYDRSFEIAYGDRCFLIKENADIIHDNRKDCVELFKIHGDLSKPESIIIAQKDYTRFFDTQQNPYMWNMVSSLMAKYNVLFIGYGLEDTNIESILRKQREMAGERKKKVFVVAPEMDEFKIKELIREGAEYINSTGENFIEELSRNIKDNILFDYKQGYIQTDLLINVLDKHNIDPALSVQNGKVKIDNLKPRNKFGNLRVQLKTHKNVLNKMFDSSEFGEPSPVTISGDEVVSFVALMNDIRVDSGCKINSVTILPVPVNQGITSVHLPHGKVYHNVQYKVYNTPVGKNFQCVYGGVKLDIKIISNNLNSNSSDAELKLKMNTRFSLKSDKQDISIMCDSISFLEDFYLGGEFKIEINKKYHSFNLFGNEEALEEIKTIKNFYKELVEIQDKLKIQYKNVAYSDDNAFLVALVRSYITQEPFRAIISSSYKLPVNQIQPSHLSDKNRYLIFDKGVENAIVQLFGNEINVGYISRYSDNAYITNLRKIKKGANMAEIRDLDDTYIIYCTKETPQVSDSKIVISPGIEIVFKENALISSIR